MREVIQVMLRLLSDPNLPSNSLARVLALLTMLSESEQVMSPCHHDYTVLQVAMVE